MNHNIFLSDEFRITGTDPVELSALLAELDEHTVAIKTTGDKIKWYVHETEDHMNDYLAEVPCGALEEVGPLIDTTDLETEFEQKGFKRTQISQYLFDGAHMFIGMRDEKGEIEIVPCHPDVTVNMAFTGVSGPALSKPTFGTVAILKFLCQFKNITLVMRTGDDGGKNIITIRSGQYMPYDQTEVIRPVTMLGGTLSFWSVENTVTRVSYEFEREVKISVGGVERIYTPEIEVSTSDSGDGSISYRLYWRKKTGGIFTLNGYEIARRHRGKITAKERADIDAKLEALVNKAGDPEKIFDDLEARRFYGDEPVAVFRNLLDDNKHYKAYASKEVRDGLAKNFASTVEGRLYVTAAEIVSHAMDASEEIVNLTDKARRELIKAAGEFPFQKLRGDVAVVAS